jgi:hypothetical protein
MPARQADKSAIGGFTDRFTVHATDAALVLAGLRMRLLFNAVEAHDLPSSLDGVRVERVNSSAGSAAIASYRLESAGRTFSVRARSLQVHERAVLYGNVITLPKFPLSQRALWAALLTVARFNWGQSLIRRLTGRNG